VYVCVHEGGRVWGVCCILCSSSSLCNDEQLSGIFEKKNTPVPMLEKYIDNPVVIFHALPYLDG
jgi:hypothetical protein